MAFLSRKNLTLQTLQFFLAKYLFSLLFWKRKPRPPPSFQPEDCLGLKTIADMKLDEVVPSKDLRLITRTSRSVLTISMFSATKMCHQGRLDMNPNNRCKKYPREFPRILTMLRSTPDGRFYASWAPRRLERITTSDGRTLMRKVEQKDQKQEYLQARREGGSLKLNLVLVEVNLLLHAPPLPGRISPPSKKLPVRDQEPKENVGEEKGKKLMRKRSSSTSSLESYALKMEENGGGGFAEEEELREKAMAKAKEKKVIDSEVDHLLVLPSWLPERSKGIEAARVMLLKEGCSRFGEPYPMVGMGVSTMRAVKT